ncbi:hypothetical protein [Schlesneria paludicola]|uniref:hypothetical protein n=1 Tax=Schlesneria paludicola TaxID=360056 RepID=UPI00029AB24A|nr:hypothetical protein [Schlesneria paludicola]
MVLQNLKAKVDTIKEITNVADGLADAIMGLQNIDIKNLADNLTSLAAANVVVWKDIKTINAATRSNLTSFTPKIDLAIQYLRRM